MAGVEAFRGDITMPETWMHLLEGIDGIVNVAATWDDEMAFVESLVADTILKATRHHETPLAYIQTGGCWLFGETADAVATEDTPYRPIAEFADAVPVLERVLTATHVRGMVIHPAMVYEKGGGVFSQYYDDAVVLRKIRVIGGPHVRWPLVHSADLGVLYALLLEKGKPGDVYCAAATEGVRTGTIIRTIAASLGISPDPEVMSIPEAIDEHGSWASGYAIDQQMSGQKAMDELGWEPVYRDPIAAIS